MPQPPVDPRWPQVLSLAVHEFRTPMTVVGGYIRMLLKDGAGPLSEPQRHLLEEAEKSCARLSGLLVEVNDLANLEAGTATVSRMPIDLRAVLAEAIARLPGLPHRPVEIALQSPPGVVTLEGDAVRLRAAFAAVLLALRRELVTSTILVVRETITRLDGHPASRIAIAAPDQIDTLASADESLLTTFDEWRGGCGLSLGVARRIIERHGGRIWSPLTDTKAGAVIALPHV